MSRAASERARIEDSTVEPEINKYSNTQEEADFQNVFCLASIGVKEGIVEGITKIVGRDITNTTLRTTENINFKSVDQYHIHQLFTVITEGAERPESSNIRRQFVNIAGTIFDWRETVVTNVEWMAAMSAKIAGLRRARSQQPTRSRNPSEHRMGGKKYMGGRDKCLPPQDCCKV